MSEAKRDAALWRHDSRNEHAVRVVSPDGRVTVVRSATYRTWEGMRYRCNSSSCRAYRRYGGRGISICERWNEFANFLADMGVRPPGLTLDRIDNDGNYEPGNCRWATVGQQARNRGSCRFVVVNGERMNVEVAARTYGLGVTTLCGRLDAGWPDEIAVKHPLIKNGRRAPWTVA